MILIGRPVAGAVFSLPGLRPRAVSAVACTSSMVVGRTGSFAPSGLALASVTEIDESLHEFMGCECILDCRWACRWWWSSIICRSWK